MEDFKMEMEMELEMNKSPEIETEEQRRAADDALTTVGEVTEEVQAHNNLLTNIENKIILLAQQDSNRWAEMAELLLKVQDEKLYTNEGLSYTQWVRHLAQKAKIHESLLWRRRKAGAYYIKLKAKVAAEGKGKGKELPEMADVKVSPDNFVLIKDIVGNNDAEGLKLVHKVLAGELTRKDLSAAKIAVLKQREAAGHKRPANGYERDKFEKMGLEMENNDGTENPENNTENTENTDELIANGITASQILIALQTHQEWLPEPTDRTAGEEYMRSKYKSSYRVLSEFPVDTGDSKHVRRIDAMVIENHTSPHPRKLSLRAIEIKVSKYDLVNDQKMSEYAGYCDFFYIAIPPELKDEALKIMMPDWGLLLVHDDGEIEVAAEAQKLPGTFRDESIETVAYLCSLL